MIVQSMQTSGVQQGAAAGGTFPNLTSPSNPSSHSTPVSSVGKLHNQALSCIPCNDINMQRAKAMSYDPLQMEAQVNASA